MNDSEKILTYISYENEENNSINGNFDNVPEDSNVAIIHLDFPSKDGKEPEHFIHRKFCGLRITAETFLGAFSRRVSVTTLIKIKEEIEKGENIMFIPLGKDFEDYIWISNKDSVYETREAFINAIHDFRDKCNDSFLIVDGEEVSIKK